MPFITHTKKKLNYGAVRAALHAHDNNKTAVARIFGVDRGTLYEFIRRNGLFIRFRLVTEPARRTMRRLREQGWVLSKIGQEVSFSKRTAFAYTMDLPVPPRRSIYFLNAERVYAAYRSGVRQAEIATVYGCSRYTVLAAINRARKAKGLLANRRERI